MSLMVRLQGLPPSADAIHIRDFFTGLKIPQEGVNIIGGVHGEAFVTFENSYYVSVAVIRSGQHLMGSPVHISAVCESQSVPGYVRVSFRPLDATLSDVKKFFKELSVESVLFLTANRVRNGDALIKFGNIIDVQKVLSAFSSPNNKIPINKFKNLKTFTVLTARKSHETEWVRCCGKKLCKKTSQASSACKLKPEMPSAKGPTVHIRECYAHLVNVSPRAKRSHIRKFLHNLVVDSQITFVYDKGGNRLRECFVMFGIENDYVRALELDKAVFKGHRLRVLPVSKESMMDIIQRRKEMAPGNPGAEEEATDPNTKYLYVRNFSACVDKWDVLAFFTGFSLTEKDICLLYDNNGDSLGEALVKFASKWEAIKAEKLNHKRYQGTEILLRRISRKQLKCFNVDSFLNHSTDMSDTEVTGADVCVSEVDDSPEATSDNMQ
ncbi:RNA-binding protein 12B-like [Bufo bufo]|uniref:RNA-binding protein 12B-like n=1 Tax=Bufo bufo TaxID=8384 RepID=UPI001ABEB1C7|nr:RNA-binding protein 12B-like [Bufo bufo]XP_040287228.1 RNA-binding protein 12B-like [Bufo bufo]